MAPFYQRRPHRRCEKTNIVGRSPYVAVDDQPLGQRRARSHQDQHGHSHSHSNDPRHNTVTPSAVGATISADFLLIHHKTALVPKSAALSPSAT